MMCIIKSDGKAKTRHGRQFWKKVVTRAVIASEAKQSMAPHEEWIASSQGLLAMTVSKASARPQRRPVADHVRLQRQRYRGRHQDHQCLGGEDRGRQIEAGFGAVEAADDGAER